MLAQMGDPSLVDTNHLVKSLNKVASANAKALYKSMGIKFPEGTYTKDGQTNQLFGLIGVKVVNVPTLVSDVDFATLKYPLSREVAGGGGMDTFKWFVVPGAKPPNLQGLLFPWSRSIWGLPKMTSVTQLYSNAFNWRRLDGQQDRQKVGNASQPLLV